MRKIKNIFKLSNIFAALSIAFILWIAISWVDVVTHNGPFCTDYEYSNANFFILIAGGE